MPEADSLSTVAELAPSLVAARDDAVVCDLPQLGALRVTGSDAATFLHAQLTSDVQALPVGGAEPGAWCSPKGRVLANGTVYRHGEGEFVWLLPAELAPAVARRLQMFVLRARVNIVDAGRSEARLGVGGPNAQRRLAALLGGTPEPMRAVTHEDARVIALSPTRFLLLVPGENADAWRTRLSTVAPRSPAAAWDWLSVRAGVAAVTAPTQDRFVPQMLNWELLRGVSFSKGCYPGQEIVARTQYRGKLKERLYLAHLADGAPAPGDPLYAAAFGEQSCGAIVNAAPAPEGGHDALAVIQTSAATEAHLGAPDGPALSLLTLPYAVPGA